MRYLIKLYDYLDIIIAAASIILTIFISSNSSSQDCKESRKKISGKILYTVLAFLILVGGIAFVVYSHDTHTIIPKLYGTTYDNAISSLYEAGLQGRLLMASTNKDLSNSDSRVVWQSVKEGEVVPQGTCVSFVIDDSFALEYYPLTAHINEFDKSEEVEVLSYHVITRDALYTIVNGNSESNQSETVSDPEYEKLNWYIEIEPLKSWLNFRSTIYRGKSIIYDDNSYEYYVYANSMAKTLKEIAEGTMSSIGSSLFDQYIIVGKLIPKDESQAVKLIETELEEDSGVIFMPYALSSGEYTFVISFYTQDGKYRDWYHDIRILDK